MRRVPAATTGTTHTHHTRQSTLWHDLQQACFTIWRRKFARLRATEEVVAELAAW